MAIVFDINTLITPLTEDQVLARFIAILEKAKVPASKWRKGGAARVILRTVAGVYAGFTELMADSIKSGFLDEATGGWLRLLAHYVYGVDFIPATFATTKITLTNAGGGLYSLAAQAYRVRNPTTGKVFTNVAPFTLNPTSSLPLLDFVAVESGSASSCAPDSITEQVTVLVKVTLTNPIAAIGTDIEDDEPLRQRCREKLGALSPLGPRDAYAFAVRSATLGDGSPAGITRIARSLSSSTGTVDIWCATASGTPSSDALAAVSASIEAIARPDTVTVNVLAASTVLLSQTIVVWAETTAGLDATTLAGLVDDALIAMIKDYPVGGIAKPPSTSGFLYASRVDAAVKSAHAAIFAVDGVSDLPIPPGAVATLASTISVRFAPARVAL